MVAVRISVWTIGGIIVTWEWLPFHAMPTACHNIQHANYHCVNMSSKTSHKFWCCEVLVHVYLWRVL